MIHRFTLLVFASLWAAPLLPAQETRRDAGGYTATAAVNYSAREILSDGPSRILQNTDEDSRQVPLGFKFSFYGNSYDQVCLSTNGVLSFGRCVGSPVNEDLTAFAPADDVPFIAPFWADLNFNSYGTDAVYYLTQGEAGKRLFIVQWNKAGVCCDAAQTVTFQVILAEDTGDILISYANVAEPNSTLGGRPATVGIRDVLGQLTGAVSQWSHRANALHDSMTLRFARPAQVQLPAITGAVNAAGTQAEIASSTWFSIYGTNLSATTRLWTGTDFTGNQLPLSLDGVRVNVNGKAAAVCYVSPGQVNALAPDDDAVGEVALEVVTAQGSGRSTLRKAAFSPAFFLYGGQPIAIVQSPDGTLLGASELLSYVARPARPGETVVLWGTGFGPTDPPTPALLLSAAARLANRVDVTIGGVAAHVDYAGMVGPGLYQLNVVIPKGLNGTVPISASVGGATSLAGITIAVRP
jgi:uncharacterized protein (TIGR03437 family)